MYVKKVQKEINNQVSASRCVPDPVLSGYLQDARMENEPVLPDSLVLDEPALPDSLVLEIFLHLPHSAVLSAGLACRQWLNVSRDEFLWRELFYSYYRIPRSVPRHPGTYNPHIEPRRLLPKHPDT